MIHFFRDILDGPLYIITTILAIILIMAIIGFIMEKKKLAKELKSKTVTISTEQSTPVVPVQEVIVSDEQVINEIPVTNQEQVITDVNDGMINPSPIFIFEDPDQRDK